MEAVPVGTAVTLTPETIHFMSCNFTISKHDVIPRDQVEVLERSYGYINGGFVEGPGNGKDVYSVSYYRHESRPS